MITTQQQLLLKQYQEKNFVSSILAEEACSYFSFIKNLAKKNPALTGFKGRVNTLYLGLMTLR